MGDLIPLVPKATPEPEVTCAQCQRSSPAETNFCPGCGHTLRGATGSDDTFRGFLPGKVIDGRYRLLERLGEGGMGTVFKVEHVRMGKVMALKVLRTDLALDPALLERFRTEARIVSKLSDPNTISVFDFGELAEGSLYIAMEYVQGRDLADVLASEGRLPERRVAQIGVQALRALAEAHEAGIVHRDIKPANVMVIHTRQGEDWVKVVDFGIAKLQVKGIASGKRTTGVAEFLGTPLYCSPEQARGEELDARSDLYSLAAMLFELLTGAGPYDAPTPLGIVTKHVMDPVPHVRERLPDLSDGMDGLLHKALSKDPADRFQTADAMRTALELLAGGPVRRTSGVASVPDTGGIAIASREDWDSVEKTLARGSHLRLYLGGLLILALLALGAGAAYWHLTQKVVAKPVVVEEEINDDPQHANLIALDTEVSGAIGAAHKAGRSDEDTFYFEVDHPGSLWVTLTGVPDLNLVLELFDADRQAQHEETPFTHVSVDDGRLGEAELLGPYTVHPGRYYLRVSERPAYDEPDPNRPARERQSVPYTLSTHLGPTSPFDEQEPNDVPGAAQSLGFEHPVFGHAGAPVPPHALERELPLAAFDFYAAVPTQGPTVVFVAQPSDRALGLLDAAVLERWRSESKTSLARRDELEKRARVSPGDKDLARDLKHWTAPFLAAATRANVDGIASLQLEGGHGHAEVLVEPLTGGPPSPADAPYGIAFAHSGPGGLAATLELSRELAAAHRPEQAKGLLKVALTQLPAAADADQARAQLAALP